MRVLVVIFMLLNSQAGLSVPVQSVISSATQEVSVLSYATTISPPPSTSLPLVGDSSCAFSANLSFGEAGQSAVVVDTGSIALAVASSACRSCLSSQASDTREDHLYPLSQQDLEHGDDVTASYGLSLDTNNPLGLASAWAGVLASDTVSVATNQQSYSVEDREFAAIHSQMNVFTDDCPHVRGIWGVAGPATDSDVLTAFLEASGAKEQSFALSLCPAHGEMHLGGVPSETANSMIYTPLVDEESFTVDVLGFSVNGRVVDLPYPMAARDLDTDDEQADESGANHALVDSGSSDIVLSAENGAALVAALQDADFVRFDSRVPSEFVDEFYYGEASLRLPRHGFEIDNDAQLLLHFGDGAFTRLSPSLFVDVRDDPEDSDIVEIGLSGLNFSVSHSSGDFAGSILGLPLFIGSTVQFDRTPRADSKFGRVGFSSTAC